MEYISRAIFRSNARQCEPPHTLFPAFYDDPILFCSMGGTEKTGTKLFAEEDIAKLAVLKSNDTVAKK